MTKIPVDWTECNGDSVCLDVSPVEVYKMQDLANYPDSRKSFPVGAEDCVLCIACVSSCPTGAITVEEE